jgi:hypothetical protein
LIRKWLSIIVLTVVAITLLSVASCGDPQELVSITIQPSSETVGAANIPVSQDAGFFDNLKAYGNYIHPPVQKDITTQVTWLSNTPLMFTLAPGTSGGTPVEVMTATGTACGTTLISASLTTNSDGSGVSSSGAVVTGTMTAGVVCFTGTGPTITIDFAGTGTGTISSSPAGLGCYATSGTSCSGSFPTGSTVTLTATPNGTFGGWAGCTIESGTTCTIEDLTSDVTVTATFN